jgi:hypothetical protein
VPGPFTVEDIQRALRHSGYTALPRQARDEVLLYTRPDRPQPIPVNPDWPQIFDGDPIFDVLHRDLGVSRRRFLELLAPDNHI